VDRGASLSCRSRRLWTASRLPPPVPYPLSPVTYATAFTIIELLVSAAILLIITGLLLSIFSKSSDAWISAQQDIERHRSARIGLGIMNRELSQALMSTGTISKKNQWQMTTNGAINFFGFTTSVFFVTAGPFEESASAFGGDMYETGYALDVSTGKLFRYSTPCTNDPNLWDPRHDTGNPGGFHPEPWMWPGLLNSFTYNPSSEPDSLVAEGVVDLKFYYSGPGLVGITNSWTTTNLLDGVTYSPLSTGPAVLPAVVDIHITTMPVTKWKQWKLTGTSLLTNQYSRVFQTTVQINNRKYQ